MLETNKDKNYRDFSNRIAFNGRPVLPGQILVPVVLNNDMKETMKPLGINYKYAESWHFPHASEIVPVAFIPTEDIQGAMETAIKIFNSDVERFLKHLDEKSCGDCSLDEILENLQDDDKKAKKDPTETTENEDKAFLEQVFGMLIDDLNTQDPKMGRIISLLADGFQKKEILEEVDLGKGKTQAYAFIEKTQKTALKLYNEKYRG